MRERIADVVLIIADGLYALADRINPEQAKDLQWVDQFFEFNTGVSVEQAAANLERLREELRNPVHPVA